MHEHALLTQLPCGLWQENPQLPQLLSSEVGSTHVSKQSSCATKHLDVTVPLLVDVLLLVEVREEVGEAVKDAVAVSVAADDAEVVEETLRVAVDDDVAVAEEDCVDDEDADAVDEAVVVEDAVADIRDAVPVEDAVDDALLVVVADALSEPVEDADRVSAEENVMLTDPVRLVVAADDEEEVAVPVPVDDGSVAQSEPE